MKSSHIAYLVVLGALFTIGTADVSARDVTAVNGGDNWVEFAKVSSNLTRAQVIDELKAARAQGLISNSQEVDYPKLPTVSNSRTREAVRAEAVATSQKQLRSIEYSSGQ